MTWLGDPVPDSADDDRVREILAAAAAAVDHGPHVVRVRPAIAAAWARSTASPGGARANRGPGTARRWSRVGVILRPAIAGAFALALATGSVAASTTPGAPLYGTRLGIEQALMPVRGSGSRAAAEVAYAERRLDEVREASGRGDREAVTAALDAFTDGLRRLAADGLGTDADALRPQLAADEAVLDGLRAHPIDAATAAALDAAVREVATLDGPATHRRLHERPSPAPRRGTPRRP